ncbi:MAG: sulfate adenylyltransferase subunit CysN [Solirubrobacteraceae bacterium]
MAAVETAPPSETDGYTGALGNRSLLRFITCGSVDDGKSTLIGRLLYEAGVLLEDQLVALKSDSNRFGTQDGELDFALLLDGLQAEREQGITIDVAYRYFSTDQRMFIVADTPGHEQYTRNMVTGASTADCAVLLVDARKGVLTQTRRHATIVSLLGIRHVAVAVNKMDLVGYRQERFRAIECEVEALSRGIDAQDVICIPVSALRGDHVTAPSGAMPWHEGPTLLDYLENVGLDEQRLQSAPLRFPVQWVIRPDLDFRGFAGTVASGTVAPGDRIVVYPSGGEARIARIVTYDGDRELAGAGESVVLTLTDELDVSRGDLIVKPGELPQVGDQLEATVVWMGDEPMLRGRNYRIRVGTRTVTATVAPLKYKLNVDSREHVAATKLELNEIGVCDLELDQPIAFDPYSDNRETGGFILIDRITNATVGAGMLRYALRRSENVRSQPLDVDKAARALQKGQKPCIVWLTGLSGAGKSTIANLLERRLQSEGRHTYLLDGDNVRRGLNKDLGFTPADRVENIRRVGEVAKLMVDAGLIVIASFISPYRSERLAIRQLVDEGEFIEVFVDVPLEIAERRDPKGLYRKARRGELLNFTGIDAPYEPPQRPEVRLDTTLLTPPQATDRVIGTLAAMRILHDDRPG